MEQHQVFTEPTDTELLVVGALVKIEVHHTSFVVHFQHDWPQFNFELTLRINTVTFPLKALNRFFFINRKNSTLVRRTDAKWSDPEQVAGKRKSNYLVKY